jgi:hypothetical protein
MLLNGSALGLKTILEVCPGISEQEAGKFKDIKNSFSLFCIIDEKFNDLKNKDFSFGLPLKNKKSRSKVNNMFTFWESILLTALLIDLHEKGAIILSLEHDGLVFLYHKKELKIEQCSFFSDVSYKILNFVMPFKIIQY